MLQALDAAALTHMINAAFRLPTLSLDYLYNALERAQTTGVPLTAEAVRTEIRWREESHGIPPHSAYISTLNSDPVLANSIPPTDAYLLPPVIRSVQEGSLAAFPLRLNHADEYIGERSVLIGDAAHTVHPLAGQGLNLGLADARSLASCIERTMILGGDIGAFHPIHPS